MNRVRYTAGFAVGIFAYALAGLGWAIHQFLALPLRYVEGVLGADEFNRRFPRFEAAKQTRN